MTANVYQYGWGSRSRWMDSSYTDRTPVLGSHLAQNKALGAVVLRRAGLPTAPHALARSADEAVQIAARLGYPVVVKPADTDGGVAVAAGLKSGAAVQRAFDAAARASKLILVEKHFDGNDYRLLVFEGRHIWTNFRQPAGVNANGVDSVRGLIELANRDPRRGDAPGSELKTLVLDDEALALLAEQQLTAQSVPAEGQFVRLRYAANVARGGMPFAANHEVHSDNSRLAEQAAAAFGLDLAGIDLIIPDIARSWRQTGAVICEVNSQPQFADVTQRHLHGDILRSLVPLGGRIPTVVVVGRDNRAVIRAMQQRMAERGWRTGLAEAHGGTVDGQRHGQSPRLYEAAQALLLDRTVDALVVDVVDTAVLATGLPMDEHDVLLLASEVEDRGDHALARLFNMLAPHARRLVVVNADDPACVSVSVAARHARQVGATPASGPGHDATSPLAGLLADAAIDVLSPA